MNLVALLILPLVGGYAFANIWYPSLYRATRESGHRLYFRSAFYGFFVLVSAFLIHIILFTTFSNYQSLQSIICDLATFECNNFEIVGKASFFLISSLSLFLGPIFGLVLNIICPKKWQLDLVGKVIKDNDFESLIMESFKQEALLLVTLSTNKIYTGWVVSAPNPSAKRKHLRLLPYLTGYRDVETQEVIFTTDYFKILSQVDSNDNGVLDHLCMEDFEVVVPTDQIVSSHLFDLNAYIDFASEDENTIDLVNDQQTAS